MRSPEHTRDSELVTMPGFFPNQHTARGFSTLSYVNSLSHCMHIYRSFSPSFLDAQPINSIFYRFLTYPVFAIISINVNQFLWSFYGTIAVILFIVVMPSSANCVTFFTFFSNKHPTIIHYSKLHLLIDTEIQIYKPEQIVQTSIL